MIRFALALPLALVLASPAMAQSFTGSWGCRNDTSAKAGIVTIYGSVYGYASATLGSGASGTGTITAYTDGAGINDGPLRASAGIEAARLIPDPNYGTAMQLETADRILLLCTPLTPR